MSTLHKGHGDSYTHQGLRPGHAWRLETRRDARDSLQADMPNGTIAEEVCVWVLSGDRDLTGSIPPHWRKDG